MKILRNYIIKEHIPPFLFSLAILMFLFLMNFLVKYITQIFGKGLSLLTIIELIFFNLAWMFAMAVPMSVLIATLMSFGRFSADNEITILKSSGVSIYKIIRPALFFSVVITILMIMFNDMVLPDFNHRARVMFRNIREKKPTLKMEPGIFFEVGKYAFMVEKIEKTFGEQLDERTNILGPEYQTETTPDKLRNVLIFDRTQPGQSIAVTAEEGYMVYSSPRKSIVFTLFNGEYHVYDDENSQEYRFSHFDRNVVVINAPEFELDEKDDDYRGDREMDVSMMMEKVRTNETLKLEETEKMVTRIQERWQMIYERIKHLQPVASEEEADLLLKAIDPKSWTQALGQSQRILGRDFNQNRTSHSRISSYNSTINRYLVEVHKKFSIPFSAIIFILVGAPLGIVARKGSMGVGATFSIFFFLVYWVGLILGEDLADRKFLTPLMAMWMPNILIGTAGLYLTWRTVKESTLINWDALSSKILRKTKSSKKETDTD